ncbi:hypothetical protein FF38_08915 [Lucilia cuprina]|uniref:ZAD domain-containing protein n=1 Tax=Lucilia cuprina TaxID=7375 RepID=A0A0L0C1J2_LUCCU|nr:hypothetical protein FF38_08915 [Lucilia cuprina]
MAAAAATTSSSLSSLSNNYLQICRICITSAASPSPNGNSNNNATQMISIFGEDSLWKKITTLADVKIERGDTLPQQVCLTCAKNTISACLFKKKCEDADNFFRQQLLIRKIESKSDQTNTLESEEEDDEIEENEIINGQHHKNVPQKSDVEEEPELNEQIYKHHLQRQINGDHRLESNGDHNDHEEDDDQPHNDLVEDDGEIKSANGQKPAFDFNSIRLMHEYMQQHLSKLNGIQTNGASDDEAGEGTGSDTDQDDEDEDGPLPLIPEIELITPSEDGGAGATLTNGGSVSATDAAAGMTHMRGYQCPHCFQIFEMKQVLKAHMQSVHGTSGPVYECTNCKKTYFYKRFLEKHIRRGRCVKKRRNQTRPMQCSDCNVLFPTGHHLGWHKRTGCPSKTAKMPLQQLFKQNIVQYNNFPRRIGIRKPENAIYLHNRKIIMANNKRKGRTRIKLDAKKIALAKQLILREATTTVIANELNISRTFAWRLRKSLVNGVSLHERVIDPPEDEEEDNDNNETEMADNVHDTLAVEKPENQLNHQPFTEHIKRERPATEDEEDEGINDNNQETDNEEHHHHQQQLEQHHLELQQQQQEQLLRESNNFSNATSVIQRTNELKLNNAQQQAQQQHLSTATTNAILEQHKLHNKISVVQQQRLMEINKNAHLNNNNDSASDSDSDNDDDDHHQYQRSHQIHEQQQQTQQETEHVNSQQQSLYLQKSTNLKDTEDAPINPLGNGKKLPLLNQISPAVAAAIHQLPVNLSIRPIASMQNSETSSNNLSGSKKKPRKPNVFIDDEKYAMAKMLVAQNASTMEIAKALNVSQMTAWKLRDAIIKGVPLSYRNRRDIRMTMMRHDEDTGSVLSEGSDTRRETDTERQQQALLVQQQLDHQQKLQQQHLQQQQQIQQLLQRQQQLQQQQQQLEQQKLQRQQERELEQQLLQKQQKQLQQQTTTTTQQIQSPEQKHSNPRRRLKAAEREVRDKEITREILELIKEDNNIQYWKVSARLAEKGYAISPSSVCQKLKSMGIHRRWKPGDKPPLIDMEQLKGTSSANHINNNSSSMAALATAAANAQNASSSADESYEQQFDMGGAHFLSAFTTR